MSEPYEFTTDWFSHFIPVWKQLLAKYPARKVLEIGSYEGRSACFIVETCGAAGPLELHCVDTWAGGVEHDRAAMQDVERRFDRNIERAMAAAPNAVQLHKSKALSHDALARLLADGHAGTFDLVYIDGSHQAPDVLSDAVLGFRLTKVGGLLVFDDYLWSLEKQGHQDAYNMPKPAIDAFVNIYMRKLAVIHAPNLFQLYTRKLAA